MTVLIDAPRWPWRGDHWCHLVSDTSYGELHEFAAELGMRRIGFQGDHYDLDSHTHDRAIGAGAILCDSRELVRRLRDAGLRRRPSSFEKWQLDGQFPDLSLPQVEALTAPLNGVSERALASIRRAAEEPLTQAFRVVRAEAVAVVVAGSGSAPIVVGDERGLGVYVRAHPTGWSVEVISPSPADHE